MKKIIIPIPEKDSITISEINDNGHYIILCYKKGKCVGYIYHVSYDDILWVFSDTCDTDRMNKNDVRLLEESLFNCITKGITEGIFDEVKLLEFE